MKRKIVAKRYAEAYLNFAKESIGRDKAVEELKELKIVMHTNRELEEFLRNPEITNQEKDDVIEKVLADFSQETRQFLKLLLDKERIAYLIEICDYVRATYSHGESVEALLKTSYPLDLDVIQAIKTRLEKKMQKAINLHLELDADLLGGVQIRIGNYIIDGSVRRRLDDLEEKLKKLQVA